MLVYHHDADGVTSAVLWMLAHGLTPDDVQARAADYFGEVTPDDKICFDMVPEDPNWEGICFDHHPQHPPEEERKYTLYWDNVPASLLVYSFFAKDIPDEEKWKVVVGIVGDGQPELIPPNIFDMFPSLLDEVLYVYGGELKFSLPRYKLLSSGINSLMRLGKHEYALRLLYYAKRPVQLLFDEEANRAREMIRNEYNKVLRNAQFVKLTNNIVYIEFESEVDVTGRLATDYGDRLGCTVVAYNAANGKVSIRGDLALWVVKRLNDRGIEAGGHPGFCGANLEPGTNFIDILREVVR